jgi:methionine-rich copper-binding protein CopC
VWALSTFARKQLVEGYFNSVLEEEWRPRYNLTAVGQNRRQFTLLLLVVFALSSDLAYAHAILVEASPSANSTVAGPSIPIKLRFSVRIDAKRSRLELVGPDKTSTLLSATQPSPDTLQAVAEGRKAGAYSLRWQVLAADGHITRGEIPFKVKS